MNNSINEYTEIINILNNLLELKEEFCYKTQKLDYNYRVAEQKRQRTLAENQKRALARQNELLSKVQIIESESETINLDFADKISKIIPYSLIPIIPIAVAYFIFKGSK